MEFQNACFTDTPYKSNVCTVKQMGNYIQISYCRAMRQGGWEFIDDDLQQEEIEKRRKSNKHTHKLDNSLSRSKSTIKELALCNPWEYWCTFTISPEKYDRYNLKAYIKDFTKFLNNYNRYSEKKVQYLLVPECHEDGAWHLHGFLNGIRDKDLYINQYGYLTWKQYENKFGFISIDKVKDIARASSYIQKYITKNIDKNVTELNAHIFYASHGLQRAELLYKGYFDGDIDWDWEHADGFVKIKNINLNYDKLENYIDIKEIEKYE